MSDFSRFLETALTPDIFAEATKRWREASFEGDAYLGFVREVLVEKYDEHSESPSEDVVGQILRALCDERDRLAPASTDDWAEFRQLESDIAFIKDGWKDGRHVCRGSWPGSTDCVVCYAPLPADELVGKSA